MLFICGNGSDLLAVLVWGRGKCLQKQHRRQQHRQPQKMANSVVVEVYPNERGAYAETTNDEFKVAALDSKPMQEGDVMSIPRDPKTAHGQTSLCFRNLSFSIKEKVIVTPTSGAYGEGTMVALMVRRSDRGDLNAPASTHTLHPPLGEKKLLNISHKTPTLICGKRG